MDKEEFINIIQCRSSSPNIEAISSIFTHDRKGFLQSISHLKEGSTTSVFDIGDGLVLKVFDRRNRQNPRVYSPYLLASPYFRVIRDQDDNRVVLEIERKLSETATEPLLGLPGQLSLAHQEVLRMALWMDGYDFWDVLPPPSNPKEIKNVLLDGDGVPFGIDEDAVRVDKDKDYPVNADGKRTLEQYLDYRKNSYDQRGRPATIGKERLEQILDIKKRCQWPIDRTYEALSPRQRVRLNAFKRIIEAIPSADSLSEARPKPLSL